MLIIALPEQHYNNPNHTRQLCPHIGPMSMKAMPFMTHDTSRRDLYVSTKLYHMQLRDGFPLLSHTWIARG